LRTRPDFGLPIIACICIINHETFVEEHHAVVISGYRSDKAGRVTEIYLHDDRIGPYCWTKSSDSNNTFSYWENDWLESSDYDTIRLDKLLIPIYPKIRYSFNKVYKTYLDIKTKNDPRGITSKLFLTEVNSYKSTLLNKEFYGKAEILMKPFPKYIWVIRLEKNESPDLDVVIDATSVFQKLSDKLCDVKYVHKS